MTEANHCSLWLIPDRASSIELNTSIQSIAAVLGTPVFSPHLTVLGGLHQNSDEVAEQCSNRTFPKLKAAVTRISTSPRFFMALYLDLDVSGPWRTLQTELATSLSGMDGPFRPHISIAYGTELNAQTLHTEQEKLKISFIGKEIGFEALAVVAASQQLPIENWRLLRTFKLN